MIEALVGSSSCERVLLYLLARTEGYPREIARFYQVDYRPIRNQLEKLEAGGILRSRSVGKTRLYTFNPRCPYLKELEALLARTLSLYPPDERDALQVHRRRPRRRGKPL